eukprot:scaffold36555_cov51-Attheya_sp.AAC.10
MGDAVRNVKAILVAYTGRALAMLHRLDWGDWIHLNIYIVCAPSFIIASVWKCQHGLAHNMADSVKFRFRSLTVLSYSE